MKKFIACVLAVVMVLGMVSCTKNGEDKIPTLVWYVTGPQQADMASVMEKANEILVDKIGAKLDLQFIDDGAYNEKITMLMSSGDEFDLSFVGYNNDYHQVANKGGLYKLDDLLKENPDMYNAIPEYAWDAARLNGSIYAVPNVQIFANATCLVFRKDLVEKYNFDVSKVRKTEDIEPFLAAVKAGEKDIYPFRTNWGLDAFCSLDDTNATEFYAGRGVSVVTDKDGKVKAVCDHKDPSFKNKAQTLRDWYEKGYVRADVMSAGDDTTAHKSGKFAVWAEQYKPGIEAEQKSDIGKDVVVAMISEPYFTTSSALATMIGINKRSKNPEKALKLIELLNTDKEFYNFICYGIEGKHYEKIDDNYVKINENAGYAPNACWKFGNTFNAYLQEGQAEDTWQATEKLNDESRKSELLGFVFDNTNVRTEMAQCATVRGEYSVVHKGAMPLEDYYDEYVKKLEKAGIEKIRKELQKQIDAFLKSKK